MIFVFLLLASASVTWARPGESLVPQNVVTVPPNCPAGQELINGVCRDVWRYNDYDVLPSNVITVPANCPDGQQLINGQCRDVWRIFQKSLPIFSPEISESTNVAAVPMICRPSQQLVNGQCRDIWRTSDLKPTNVITVPPNCPQGQQLINGICRDVWRNGKNHFEIVKLMEIFKKLDALDEDNIHGNSYDEQTWNHQELNNKNIISVPNQCPVGFKPDALGVCRQIFDF